MQPRFSPETNNIPSREQRPPSIYRSFQILIETDKFRMQALDGALTREEITLEQYTTLLRIYAKRLESQKANLENEVGIDSLTGIPNLHFLERNVSEMIEEINRPKDTRKSGVTAMAVVTIDLKALKSFNSYGQDVGDKALQTFVRRLQAVVKRTNDQVFRVGGDEFRVVMPLQNVTPDFDFSSRLAQIHQDLEDDLSIEVDVEDDTGQKVNTRLPLGAYLGCSIFRRGDTGSSEELLRDSAREMAKYKNGVKAKIEEGGIVS